MKKKYVPEELQGLRVNIGKKKMEEICVMRKTYNLPCTGCVAYQNGECQKGNKRITYTYS